MSRDRRDPYRRDDDERESRRSGPRREDGPRSAMGRGGDTPRGGRSGGSGPSSRPPSYGSNGSGGNGGGGRGGSRSRGYDDEASGERPTSDRYRSGRSSADDRRGAPSDPRRGDDRSRRPSRDERDDYSAQYSAPRRSSGRGGRSMRDRMRDAGRNLSQQFSAMMESVGRSVRAEPPRYGGRPIPAGRSSHPSQPSHPSRPASRASVSPALAATLGITAYRRSRSRMLARKWRMGRIRPNPVGYAAGFATLILLSAAVIGAGSAGGVYAAQYYQTNRGAIRSAWIAGNNQSTRIYDRNGTLLYATTNAAGFQFNVPYNYLNQEVIKATVDTEDRTFWTNAGLNVQDTIRALYVDLSRGGADQGASTITQQLVKLLVIQNSEKTLDRKIHEAILSIGMTKNNGLDPQGYEKWQIMQMYLNNISYHYPNTGIEAAARNYFGLAPILDPKTHTYTKYANQQLTLAQIAILVRIPNNPSLYYPLDWSCKSAPCPVSQWGSGNEWNVLNGADTVLASMAAVGDVTPQARQQAHDQVVQMLVNEQIYYEKGLSEGTINSQVATKKAPHFVDYVLGQLETEFGMGTLNNVASAGLSVYTTLDLNLETFMETDAAMYINGDPVNHQFTRYWYCTGGEDNVPCVKPALSISDNVHNVAGVAIDPWTGDILGMMGSVDYASTDKQVLGYLNMATAAQSMGSSTKPLVYSTAFQMGWNPGTVLQDMPMCYPGPAAPPEPGQKWIPDAAAPACTTPDHMQQYYTPHDYDATSFSGSAPIRVMLANSLNIPATQAQYFVGANGDTATRFLSMIGRMGIPTCTDCKTPGVVSAQRLGPTTALGTQEIPLVNLTSAYGTFAAGGLHAPMRAILQIRDNSNNVLWTAPTPKPAQAMSPQAAYMITSILTDNQARAGDFKQHNPLYLPYGPPASAGDVAAIDYPYIAAKTGTAQGTTGPSDIVTMGYSPYMVLGVWAGNSDPHDDLNPNIIGITGAGYVFHDVMSWAVRHYNWPLNQGFAVPPDLARGMFNCTSGLAPYKGQTPPADPNNLGGPPDWWWCMLSQQAQDDIATNLYVGYDTGKAYPDIDWYIKGQYPLLS